MSKTSYVLIGILVAAVAFIIALRGYRAYEAYAARQEAEAVSTFTFQNVPVALGMPEATPVSKPVRLGSTAQMDVFLEDAPLTAEQEHEQASDTVLSIISDYEQDGALMVFNKDLSDATDGKIKSLSDLSGPELANMMTQYPQVGQVIERHLKDPKFASVIQAIFTNPQFVQSVAVLQGRPQTGQSQKN